MRHFLRHLPLLLALSGCVSAPPKGHARTLAAGGIGCERAELGIYARAIAVYTRVVAEKVCTLDAAGRCRSRAGSGAVSAEVRLPRTANAIPTDALRQELGRRGILARIARPRGPKMYASYGNENTDAEVLELGEIGITDDGDVAHVMVRAAGIGELMRLARTLEPDDSGTPRGGAPLVRACWSPERSPSSALAD